MANSKGETSGKALEDGIWPDANGSTYQLRVFRKVNIGEWNEGWVDAPDPRVDAVTCYLIANPEARMAVLEKLFPRHECPNELPPAGCIDCANRDLYPLLDQQKQLEREVAELRKELENNRRVTDENWKRGGAELAEYLSKHQESTPAGWVSAEALRLLKKAETERDDQRAKLSESERKLVRLHKAVCAILGYPGETGRLRDSVGSTLFSQLISSMPEAPVGGELVKPMLEPHVDFGISNYNHEARYGTKPPELTHPTAEPRSSMDVGPRWHGGFTRELEPADPAPPRSDRDKPVMMSELMKALHLEASGRTRCVS